MDKPAIAIRGFNRILMALVLIPVLLSCAAKGNKDKEQTVAMNTLASTSNRTQNTPRVVREPVVAGPFYPGDKSELSSTVEGYIKNAQDVKAPEEGMDLVGIISPHAGYMYSGPTAGWAFRQLKGKDFKRVILIGPSHTGRFPGAAVTRATDYKTPLGLYPVDPDTQTLLSNPLFSIQDRAEAGEHSLEVQVPFLQTVLPNAAIIPVIVGFDNSYKNLVALADALAPLVDSGTLVAVSSDFTHYGPNYGFVPFTSDIPAELEKMNKSAAALITALDSKGFYDYIMSTGDTICGAWPIVVAMEIIKKKYPGAKGGLLKYDTSGNVTGDYTNSVSYAALGFYAKAAGDTGGNSPSAGTGDMASDRGLLLQLARESIKTSFEGKPEPEPDQGSLSDELKTRKGCFVTLTIQGELRGCIGDIIGSMPLYQCVITNARNAAFSDPRFNPLSETELSGIRIEVSILSEPKPLGVSGEAGVLGALRPNVDGVILERGYNRSTYLPQVWEQLPGKEEFLGNLCVKGGMEPGCWKDTSTKIYTYQVEYFNESEL